MISPFCEMIDLAVIIVAIKYPNEFVDSKMQDITFALTDMVLDELVKKNGDIFTKPLFDSLVDIHDLNIGDKEEFTYVTVRSQDN